MDRWFTVNIVQQALQRVQSGLPFVDQIEHGIGQILSLAGAQGGDVNNAIAENNAQAGLLFCVGSVGDKLHGEGP